MWTKALGVSSQANGRSLVGSHEALSQRRPWKSEQWIHHSMVQWMRSIGEGYIQPSSDPFSRTVCMTSWQFSVPGTCLFHCLFQNPSYFSHRPESSEFGTLCQSASSILIRGKYAARALSFCTASDTASSNWTTMAASSSLSFTS